MPLVALTGLPSCQNYFCRVVLGNHLINLWRGDIGARSITCQPGATRNVEQATRQITSLRLFFDMFSSGPANIRRSNGI